MGKGSKEGKYLRVLSIIYDMFESLHGQVLKRVVFVFCCNEYLMIAIVWRGYNKVK